MLGMTTSGGQRGGYAAIRKQMHALAACRLLIGMQSAGKVVTIDTKPVKRFEAWLQQDDDQPTLWPGVLELSPEFFETLQQHAVPLDYRALGALKHSALALDVYTWLAHRLCRITRVQGNMVSWNNLREQFGQEYKNGKDFKREFKDVLRQVLLVYPSARIDSVIGGIILRPSPPPISRTMISVSAVPK